MDYEYDIIYKYYLRNSLNWKNTYCGRGLENVDVQAPLSLFLDIEPTTNIPQQFVFAVTVYLVNPITGEVLFLKQTKDSRVVDEYVGVGGKARSIFDGDILKGEKILTTDALNKSIDFKLSSEDLVSVACREVMEETSTYEKDNDGNYTSNIIVPGLITDPKKMEDIGLSKIRLILPNKAEAWMIYNYMYELSLEELEFLKSISYENREGVLEWRSIQDTIPFMSLADQIVLNNKNPRIVVSEIRDSINSHSYIKSNLELPDKRIMVLEDSDCPKDYKGVIKYYDYAEEFSYPSYYYLSNVSKEEKNKDDVKRI